MLYVNCELEKLCIIVWSAGTFNHTPSNEVWKKRKNKGQKSFSAGTGIRTHNPWWCYSPRDEDWASTVFVVFQSQLGSCHPQSIDHDNLWIGADTENPTTFSHGGSLPSQLLQNTFPVTEIITVVNPPGFNFRYFSNAFDKLCRLSNI